MDSAFVSPSGARLRLASEADVLAAIDNSVLGESHYLDLKREAKPGSGPNKETGPRPRVVCHRWRHPGHWNRRD